MTETTALDAAVDRLARAAVSRRAGEIVLGGASGPMAEATAVEISGTGSVGEATR